MMGNFERAFAEGFKSGHAEGFKAGRKLGQKLGYTHGFIEGSQGNDPVFDFSAGQITIHVHYDNSAQDFRFDRPIRQVFEGHGIDPDCGQDLASGQRDFSGALDDPDLADCLVTTLRGISGDIKAFAS